MADIVVHVWVEPIDDKVACACCKMTETYRGAIYGASSILLFEISQRTPWSAKRQAYQDVEAKLRRELAEGVGKRSQWGCRHRMPRIGWVRDDRRA